MSYLSGKCLKKLGDFKTLPAAFDVLAAVLVWAMCTLIVGHAYHHGQWDRLFNLDSLGINTYTTIAIVWLLLAMSVIFFPRAKCNKRFLNVSYAAYLGAMVVSLVFGVLSCNPVWNEFSVGSMPIWNGLLFYYGLPMLLILVVMVWGRWDQQARLIRSLGAVKSLILAFVLLSLEVRQIYQGAFLNGDKPGLAEMYTYSAAWLGFAMMLLGLGLWRSNAPLRYAGMAVMTITIGKVFLLDTRHLEDIYRVMSFLGLGLCLFGIAIGYQLVVRKKRVTAS